VRRYCWHPAPPPCRAGAGLGVGHFVPASSFACISSRQASEGSMCSRRCFITSSFEPGERPQFCAPDCAGIVQRWRTRCRVSTCLTVTPTCLGSDGTRRRPTGWTLPCTSGTAGPWARAPMSPQWHRRRSPGHRGCWEQGGVADHALDAECASTGLWSH
jgi:hypothetical protein